MHHMEQGCFIVIVFFIEVGHFLVRKKQVAKIINKKAVLIIIFSDLCIKVWQVQGSSYNFSDNYLSET